MVKLVGELLQALAVLPLRHLVNVPQKLEGIAHRHIPPELRALAEHHADAAHMLPPIPQGDQAVHRTLAGIRRENAAHHLDGAAFPRPVRPNIAHHLPVPQW